MTTAEQSSGAPPPGDETTRWVSGRLPAIAASVPVVRRAIVEFAHRHGASAQLAGDVGLAVSEAVDNIVLHAYEAPDDGVVHYAADVDDGDLEIVIADEGGGIREGVPSEGLGLGLRLIAAVSSDFAITARPEGLEVWMRFALGTAL